jgi:hypothetical protein
MTQTRTPGGGPNRPGTASVLRFVTELVARVATPWALTGWRWLAGH